MKTTEPFSVLVTGQLRTPELLLRSLREWCAMRASGLVDRILMVTWQSEADRDPALIGSLERNGLEVMIRPDPRIRGIGNVWPQMLAMDIGLRAIAGGMVFKSRSDLRLDPRLLEWIATTTGYLDLCVPPGSRRVFDRRVWVPWFELTTPFYLSDECMFGTCDDLRRLINYDESYSLCYPVACGITHYRRFVHPFRAITDRFEPFLERFTETGLGANDRWARIGGLLLDPEYLRCLASAYAIYGSHFRVLAPDGSLAFRDWSTGVPEPAWSSLGAAFTEAHAGLPSGHLFCRDDAWLHALLAGEIGRDDVGDRFADALRSARDDGLGWIRPDPSIVPEHSLA